MSIGNEQEKSKRKAIVKEARTKGKPMAKTHSPLSDSPLSEGSKEHQLRAPIPPLGGKNVPFLNLNDMTSATLTADQETDKIATSRRLMIWVFADKNRLFWVMQAVGWLGFLFLHILSNAPTFGGIRLSTLPFSFASVTVGLIVTTFFLRPVYRYARRQEPILLLTLTIGASAIMALIMSMVKTPIYFLILGDEWFRAQFEAVGAINFLLLILPGLPVNIFLILTWAGFYFGVNYYLTLREETQRALLSARLADQAQLKMLRYQLNPHFLFNTLNAISTLVMSKQNDQANAMLHQLSAFLRYSLDSDPLLKTTLADEIKASQLYLAIEKTRFADRLNVVLDIDDEVLKAKVPSLILQPAIENSIKFAIGVMEEGGEIRLVARRLENKLILQVCDNGTNAPENPEDLLIKTSKSGVGVINMRDRLIHLYGDEQKFELKKIEPQGLCVSIMIPFENTE